MASFDYVTSRGVIVPDTEEIQAEVIAEWREAFGEDLVVTEETPQGVLISAEIETRDSVARNNAALANQINPDLAGGVFLDAIWALTMGSRRGASRSLISGAVLGGQPGTIVPAGSLATVSATGQQFSLTGTAIIGAGGTTTANLQAVNPGPVVAIAGGLNQVATSVLGWETITNPNAAVPGRLIESDISARRRRRNTLALQSVSLSEAITSRLYDIDGVRSLSFRENTTNAFVEFDGITLAPHSIYVCVDGGTDLEVARALLETKTLGAGWNGGVTVEVVDQHSGQSYTVQFDRPEVITLFARVTARANGLDAQTIIPNAIISYANGELDGDAGLVVGADVSPFEFAGAVNQVEPRIFVTKVELSTDGSTWSTGDIAIDLDQKASISPSAVQVVLL